MSSFHFPQHRETGIGFKSRNQGSERLGDSSKVTELISDDQELDLGPQCQFQGTAPHVMWHLLCVWTMQGPHSLFMRETGHGPESGHGGAPSRPPATRGIAGPGHQLPLWNPSLPWPRSRSPQAAPHRWLKVAGALGTAPSWGTWSSSGWLGTLSQAPSGSAQLYHDCEEESIPASFLSFPQVRGQARLPAAPWSVLVCCFSKAPGYHSLSHSFIANAPARHISRLRKPGEDLVFRLSWNSRWTKKAKGRKAGQFSTCMPTLGWICL